MAADPPNAGANRGESEVTPDSLLPLKEKDVVKKFRQTSSSTQLLAVRVLDKIRQSSTPPPSEEDKELAAKKEADKK